MLLVDMHLHANSDRCLVGVDCNTTENLLNMLSTIKGYYKNIIDVV